MRKSVRWEAASRNSSESPVIRWRRAAWQLAGRSLGWTALLCCTIFPALFVQAQEARQPLTPTRVNAARLRWFQYKLVAGRLVATSSYPDGMNISFGPSTTGGRMREQLQLLILKDRASIHYELAGDGEELSIVLAESGEFSIRRSRDEPPLEFQFLQPPGAPLSLVLDDDGQQTMLAGDSFWHLYLADPELVARELIPYLQILRPAWQLAAMGEEIERTLILRAQQPPPFDKGRWNGLVQQLGSESFAEREAAHRELAQLGQVILPYLDDLDRAQLDAEQVSRIEALIDDLSVNYEDNTDRVANWLAGDVAVWIELAEREEPATRRVAAEQLHKLAGSAIDFDPQADSKTRRDQLARLRRRLIPTASRPAESVPPPGVE